MGHTRIQRLETNVALSFPHFPQFLHFHDLNYQLLPPITGCNFINFTILTHNQVLLCTAWSMDACGKGKRALCMDFCVCIVKTGKSTPHVLTGAHCVTLVRRAWTIAQYRKSVQKNVHEFLFMHSLTPPFRVFHLFSISHVYIMDLPVSVLLSILRFSFPVQFHAELLLRAVVSRHHPAKQRKLYVIILSNKESFTSITSKTSSSQNITWSNALHTDVKNI